MVLLNILLLLEVLVVDTTQAVAVEQVGIEQQQILLLPQQDIL
jgi:hypothetical protein